MVQTVVLCFLLVVFNTIPTLSQSAKKDSLTSFKDKIKTGWNVGAFPAIGYAFDQGYTYGGLANFYYYGDGKKYPQYYHSIYVEWSRTTFGGGITQYKYDSKYLIPHIRVISEGGLYTEQALGFYGFNGYNAPYNSAYEDKNNLILHGSPDYYRYQRSLLRFTADLQGFITDRHFRWVLGYNFLKFKIATVDITKQNKGKSENDKIPEVPILYDKYVLWGFIPENQKNGGVVNIIKSGIVYDTRDNEPNPFKGMWTEVLLLLAPSSLGNKSAFTKFVFTHRQYFTLKRDVLSLAGRICYQAKIGGTVPFYLEPVLFSTSSIRDGIGGSKTVRGILRNRIVGEDILFGNLELRYKVFKTFLFNQNFYAALTGFTDVGRVTGKYKLTAINADAEAYLKQGQAENWHQSVGFGMYCAMNQNFIAAINYGFAIDKRDGNSGMYINLDFLF